MKRKVGLIYFVKPKGLKGPIKIGFSYKPTERLSCMQGSSPWPLEIIGTVSGTIHDERFLHRCFPSLHSHGEWFRWSSDLARTVEQVLQAGIAIAYGTLIPTGLDQPWTRKKRSLETRRRQSDSLRQSWAQKRRRAAETALRAEQQSGVRS